jgi:ligand-binding sensor domain-containing protein
MNFINHNNKPYLINRSKVLLLVVQLFIGGVCFGQDPPVINYSEQNGLSTSVIYGLFQDSEDNIWFCTNSGAVKFNGHKLVSYKKKDGLTGNEVFKIFEDSKQRLWFMTANGLISYYFNKKIYNEKDHPVFSQLNIKSFISDIREDDEHNIWIVPNTGNIYILSENLESFEMHPSRLLNSILCSYKGSKYLASMQGLYSLQTQSFAAQSGYFKPGGYTTRHCQVDELVYSGGYNRLLVYKLDNAGMEVHEMPGLAPAVNSIVAVDSILYICSGNGLHMYDRKTLKEKKQYFSSSNVSHVLKDREGSLWVSTLNEGVLYIPNSRINFLKSSDFFEGNKVLKVNGLGNHVIIGQTNSRVTYYHNGNLKPLVSPNKSIGEGLTYLIKAIEPDTGFIISTQSGITKFTLPGKLEFDSNILFLDYAFINKTTAYVSTPSSIGEYHNPLNLQTFRSQQMSALFEKIRAEALLYDPADSVLYACSKLGLFRFKNRKKLPGIFNNMENTSYTDIINIGKGNMVTSSMGDGIFFFNKKKIRQVNEKDGLSDNMCTSLFAENDSTIWVATLNGLNRISSRFVSEKFEIKIRNFYRNDGLPSNYINDIYVYGDTIWLATNFGLAIFNKNDLSTNVYTPKISIETLKANNENILQRKNKLIELNRKNNNIIIEFNCRTFKNSGTVRYKYKMGGLNSNWTETMNNQVDFTGLAPGRYTFEVFAYSVDENWKTNVEQIKFYIKPAYWQTLWFRILLAALFLLSVILIVFYRFKKVKGKFAVQQKIINYEKELLELEQQALRLQMNPHFIFNALNSIQYAILSGKQNDAYNSLELFSSLIRGILENSKYKFISLEDEIEILKIYIEIEAKRFSSDFKYEVNIDPDIDTSGIKIPPMLIQPFVENSIWHGLMPKTEGEKKLILSFASTDDAIICKVEDNGIGRNKAAAMKSKKHGTSLGTALTFNRVANINMLENKPRYAIEIYDKANDGGTIVTITIQR